MSFISFIPVRKMGFEPTRQYRPGHPGLVCLPRKTSFLYLKIAPDHQGRAYALHCWLWATPFLTDTIALQQSFTCSACRYSSNPPVAGCFPEHRRYAHISALDLCEYLTIHLVHKLSADVKSKSASLQVFCVCTSPKAFKDVRQIRIGKRTAAILHSNKNTTFLFGKADWNFLAVAVFYGVLHYILNHLDASVKVSAYKAITIFSDKKISLYERQFFGIVKLDFCYKLRQLKLAHIHIKT